MNRSLYVLFLTIFIDLLGFGIVIPILPNYVKELGGDDFMVGPVAAVFSVMSFFFTPIWGSLSDKYGRRPILLLTLFISMAAYSMLAFSSSLAILLISRIVSGIGSGNISVAQAFIADSTAPEKRAKAMGLVGAAFSLGFIFGPPIGGFVKEHFGFEALGILVGSLCFINLVIAYFILPESLKVKNTTAKIKYIPVDELVGILKIPGKKEIFLINLIYITAFFMFQITATLIWKDKYAFGDDQIALVFSLLGISSAAMQMGLTGWFTKLFGEYKLLITGTVILMFCLATMSYVPPGWFLILELPLLVMIAVANGMAGPSSLSLVSRMTAPSEQGRTLGLFQSYGALARVIGPLAGGTLYAINMHVPYIFGALILLINFILALGLKRYLGSAAGKKTMVSEAPGTEVNTVPSDSENSGPSHL